MQATQMRITSASAKCSCVPLASVHVLLPALERLRVAASSVALMRRLEVGILRNNSFAGGEGTLMVESSKMTTRVRAAQNESAHHAVLPNESAL